MNTNLKGLPAFFQSSGTTVFDELTKFDSNKEEFDFALPSSNETFTYDENAFGDFNTDKLPAYFNQEPVDTNTYLMQSLSLSNKNDLPPLPPGARIAISDSRQGGLTTDAIQRGWGSVPPNLPHPAQTQQLNDNRTYSSVSSVDNKPFLAPPPNLSRPPSLNSLSDAAESSLNNNNNNPNIPINTNIQPVNNYNYNNNNISVNDPTPFFAPKKHYPKSQFMSSSDIRFIVNKVLQPIETNDPYAEDFYFLQFSIKKNNEAREKSTVLQQDPPPMIYVPLPTWKETKERIKLQMEVTKNTFREKSRKWEEQEKVLGHMVRSDISRPREQLAMPTWSEIDWENDENDENGPPGELRAPFSSRLWSTRLSVQRGFEALYTVQELQHLLSSPIISANATSTAEILKDIESAVALLSQSIGIRIIGNTPVPTVPGGEFSLDGGHVGALLQTPKGKALVRRSLKLLSPEHRWALLPVILAKTLRPTSTSSSKDNNNLTSENQSVEYSLLKTIIEFLQYSYQFQVDQQKLVPTNTPAIFSNVFLIHLRQCVKSVMVTQMEKNKLRDSLLSDKTRAEVMHVIVQIGDKVSNYTDTSLKEEWIQTREAFMSMLDN